MFENDFIMWQLSRFAEAVAERLGGEQTEEVDALQDDIESLIGAPLAALEGMAAPALLSMFPATDQLGAQRAMALGVALSRQALERNDDRLRGRALLLLDHAIGGHPGLDVEAIAELRRALRGQLDEGLALH